MEHFDEDELFQQCLMVFIHNVDWQEELGIGTKRRKLNYPDLWETKWGRMLRNPDLSDPSSYYAKKFRRKFRCPYPFFHATIVPICRENNVYGRESIIPIELL